MSRSTAGGRRRAQRPRSKRVAPKGVKASGCPATSADIADHEAMLDAAEDGDRSAHTLVNNAGVSVLSRGDLLDVTEESYDRCIAVNAKALFFLSQAFARRLVARERATDCFYSSSTCHPPTPWRSPSSAANTAPRRRRRR